MNEPTNGSVESRPTVAQDNIVTRLRDREWCWCNNEIEPCEICFDRIQAADEIERLRADRDRWRDLADSLARFGNCESPDCPDCDHDWKLTYQIYEQAVRGE